MQRTRVAIYGAGGFGREVAWLIEECNLAEEQFDLVGFIDDDPAYEQLVNGCRVFGIDEIVRSLPKVQAIVSVGDPRTREHLTLRAQQRGLEFATLVHPSVLRSRFVDVGTGAVVCAGCVMTTNIVLGSHVHVNLNSTIGHDVVVGKCSTVGPGVQIAGCVNIGKRVFIGAGTVIINGTRTEPLIIGDDVSIGAGSCVIRSLPPGSHVFGNPARPIP